MQEGKIDGYEIGGDRATDLLVRLRLVRLVVEEAHCNTVIGGIGVDSECGRVRMTVESIPARSAA